MNQGVPALRMLRLVIVTVTASLAIILAVLVATGLGLREAALIWLVLPVLVGVANTGLLAAVGSTVRPLPVTMPVEQARRTSLGTLRTLVLLRMALAEAPALIGVAAAFAADSLLPYLAGLAFAVPLMLIFAYPRTAVVDAVRERLEANGATSRLWEAVNG